MIRSLFVAAGLAGIATTLSACSMLDKMNAPALKGAPDSTGLVVLEPHITVYAALLGIRQSATPVGGLLVRVDGTAQTARGAAAGGYLIFPDLAPGRWQVTTIEGDWQAGSATYRNEYPVPLESAGVLTFDVKSGEPIYVGMKIEDDARSDTKGLRFKRRDDPEAEKKAWTWMGETYEKTAWTPLFQARAATAATAVPAASPKSGG